MRLRLNFIALSMICVFWIPCTSSLAQLHYESLVSEVQGLALLRSATSSAVSPDGKYVYTSSFEDNAVTIFERNEVSGDLTFIQSLRNGNDEITGLGGAYDIEVTPDGKHVIVTGSTDHAVVVFSRNSVDGSLTMVQTIEDGVAGVDGLQGAYSIGMSPDANSVYITGSEEDALVTFSRNAVSGELSFVAVQKKGTNSIGNMAYPLEVMVSPDGNNVYVSSLDDNAITVFTRNTSDGTLTFLEDHVDGNGGISGLQGAYSLFVSPDGEHIYATGTYDNAVVSFDRNTSSGRLGFIAKYTDGSGGVDGLEGVTGITVSPDGKTVVAAGSNEDAISIFSRDETDGTLSFVSMASNGSAGVNGMEYPIALLVSPDGSNLYTTSFGAGAMVTFDLNTTSNMVSYSATEATDVGFQGLSGVEDMAVSPDNKYLYITGTVDDALLVFERDLSTGELEYVQSIVEGQNGITTFNGINGVSVSPDGKNVYVTAFWEQTVTVFDRDVNTGMLTFREIHRDGLGGVDGLNGSNNILVSADGQNVYASSYWEHGLAVFSRNSSTGALTFQQVFKNNQGGVDGIIRPSSIIESPDESNIYVTGSFSNAIAIFSRQADGTLTYSGVVKDGVNGVNGLRGANSASISSDGMHVYVAGPSDNGLAVFSRDGNNGMLSFIEYIQNGIDNVGGLQGVNDVEVSADGKRVYTSSGTEKATTVFNRDPNTGMLTFEKMQQDGVNGVVGIQDASQVEQSTDGKFIYIANGSGNTMGVFSCTYFYDEDQTICEGETYEIAGQTYTNGGKYEGTVVDGSCTYVIDFELEVIPTNYSISQEVCSGSSFVFDGNTYTMAGQYTGNFTNHLGCDSIVTLDLSFANTIETEFSAEICDGDIFTWDGNDFSSAGDFVRTFTAAGGCDSIVTCKLSVLPTYTTDLVESICEGEFYVIGTRNVVATGNYTEVLTAQTGCDSIVNLQLTVVGNNTVYNETICEGEVFSIGGSDYNVTGTYQVDLETSSGCSAQATLNLTVFETPEVDINETICTGDTYILNGVSYSTSGVYTETFATSAGCDSIVTLDLVVVPNTTNLLKTICEGDSYEVAGNSYTTTGVYTDIIPSLMGCGDSTINLDLTVIPAASTLNEQICEGDSYTLGGNTYSTTGTYTETINSGNGCMTTVTLNLEVVQTFTVDVNASICTGENYTVGTETFDSPGTYTVNMISSAGCDSVVVLNLGVNAPATVNLDETICDGESFMIGTQAFTTSGTYTEVISTLAGCDSTVNLELTVLPTVSYTSEIIHDNGRGDGAINITINDGTPPYTFVWSNGATTQNISSLSSGSYTVTITNGNGCERSETFEVQNTTSIQSLEALGLKLQLLNNPVAAGGQAQLRIEAPASHLLTLNVFNLNGQRVSTRLLNATVGASTFDIQSPNVAGLYLIQVSNEKGHATTLRLAVQ